MAMKKAALKAHFKAKLMANMDENGIFFGTDEVFNAKIARIREELAAHAQATGSKHNGGAGGVAGAPIAEEAGGGAKATRSAHIGGTGGVSVAPIANQGVESQQVRSGQTEKGKEVAAEADSQNTTFRVRERVHTIFAVGTRVTCLKMRGAEEDQRTAVVVSWRETKNGVKYYVHYIGYHERFNEWLLYTFVKKFSDEDILPRFKSPEITPITPADHSESDTTGTPEPRKSTRNLNRQFDETTKPTEKLSALDQSSEKEHEEKNKEFFFKDVWLGKHEMETRSSSPYPEGCYQDKLYICEFCLKYMKEKETIYDHEVTCMLKNPPGDEIYITTAPITEQVRESDGTGLESTPPTSGSRNISSGSVQHLSVYEVDGSSKNKLYCQNLCLLARLFLEDKDLYDAVDSFLFYILTENDASGKHLVAYFSKEKDSENNISCILTLPPFQRKGYGSFLIAFAYELFRKEGKVGTPERPLSDLGKAGFDRYWKRVLLEAIRDHPTASLEPYDSMIQELTKWTSIRREDVISTLRPLKLVRYYKSILVPNFTSDGTPKRAIFNLLEQLKPQPDWLKIDTDKIRRPVLPSVSPHTPKRARTPRRRRLSL